MYNPIIMGSRPNCDMGFSYMIICFMKFHDMIECMVYGRLTVIQVKALYLVID